MGSQIEGAVLSEVASGALGLYLRVKHDGNGELALAGNEEDIGTTEKEAFNQGDLVAVRCRNAQGTVKIQTSEAVSKGDDAFTAASGQCGSTDTTGSGGVKIGRFRTGTGGAGEVAEVIRFG